MECRFLHEALLAIGLGEGIAGQHFERNGTVEMAVVGLVDDAHTAFAEFAGYAKVRQLLPTTLSPG